MPQHRDVAAFDQRAAGYGEGWLGRLHRDMADRAAALAREAAGSPRSILDVGCGPGYLLLHLAADFPQAERLTGLDAAPAMIKKANAATPPGDGRLAFTVGVAERLPYPDHSFDLVVSTTSFDHWADQQAGLRECARVLTPGGHLVLADLFSPLLIPTQVGTRRGKARTRARATRLLAAAGFAEITWQHLFPLISAATAAVPD
ncbi:MAG: class I SAM-dependent methyltransferase [Streptosporangiaceae bacterium]